MTFLPDASWYPTTARVFPFGASARSCAENGNGAEKYLVSCGGTERHQEIAPTTRIRARAPATSQASASRRLLAPAGARPTVCPPLSAIQLNSLDRSPTCCQRLSGSFATHFLMSRSSAGGVSGCKAEMGCGSEERIVAIKLARLFPAKAGLPVAIS